MYNVRSPRLGANDGAGLESSPINGQLMNLTAMSALQNILVDVAELDGPTLLVMDEERFRDETIAKLSVAAESEDGALAEAASWLVWTASQSLGSGVGSLKGVYDSMGRDEISRTAVACFEIRLSMVRPVARAVFAAADALDAGTICFSPRLDWTSISAFERRAFVTRVLTAAIQKRWTLPVFFTAGPFSAHGFADQGQLEAVAASLADGFCDICLVPENSLKECPERDGASRSRSLIELARFIRAHQPEDQPVSLTAAAWLTGGWSRESLSSCAAHLGALNAKFGLSKFQLPHLDDALTSARASDALEGISQLAELLRTANRIAGASVGGAAWLNDALALELLDCKTVEARLGTWLDAKVALNEDDARATFEASLEDRVRKLLDRLEERGTRDFVRKHAIPMPSPRPRPTTL